MCGIVAAMGADQHLRADVVRATDTLSLRGPDGSGVSSPTKFCHLGHRRLSIIDVDGGVQPMSSPDGQYHITYNGEIYNYKELRHQLQSEYDFKTDSDTEVILAGYQKFGVEILQQLRGMFAFVIFDKKENELLIARDPFGIKPMVYAQEAGSIFVASEIKALKEFKDVPGAIDEKQVNTFFTLKHTPSPHTIYHGIKKLPAGHYARIVFENGKAVIQTPVRYWDPHALVGKEAPMASTELLEHIKESVGAHMVADVPVGAFLSGGLDSSSVVWAMSQFTKPKTFTVGFKALPDDKDLHFSRLMAQKMQTDHTEILLDLKIENVYRDVIGYFDEPFADPAVVVNWYVAQAASSHVKVALSGDGGDELFFGYGSYARIQRALRLRSLFGVDPDSFIAQRYFNYQQSKWSKVLNNSSVSYPKTVSHSPIAQRVRMMDVGNTLQDYYLRKVDGVSMHNSLEVRVPFVDRILAERILPINPTAHYDKHGGKALLRVAMSGVLPKEVLARPKQGFVRPWKKLFSGSMKSILQDQLLSDSMRSSGFFNMSYIQKMLREADGGKDHSQVFWRLLVFSLWLQKQNDPS